MRFSEQEHERECARELANERERLYVRARNSVRDKESKRECGRERKGERNRAREHGRPSVRW